MSAVAATNKKTGFTIPPECSIRPFTRAWSELQAQTQLPTPHLCQRRGRCDLARRRRIDHRVRLSQVHVIQCIEQLDAELSGHLLGESETLGQARIQIDETGAKERIASHVSEGP